MLRGGRASDIGGGGEKDSGVELIDGGGSAGGAGGAGARKKSVICRLELLALVGWGGATGLGA